jgi:hypothetical protein
MNDGRQDHRDDALSKTLKEWRVDAPLPPAFAQSVWKRIDEQAHRANHSVFEVLRSWMDGIVRRPRLAATFLAAFLFVGGSIGWTQGHRDSVRLQDELADRYVRSLDPYRAPRS